MNADIKQVQNNLAFDKRNKVIITIAISLIPGSFLHNFIINFKFSLLFTILFPIVMIYTGYGIQFVMSKLVYYNNNYDNYEEFLDIKTLLPHQIFNIAISVLIYILTYYYLLKLSMEYKYSLLPLIISIFTFICILTGIILWFLPQQILITKSAICKCLVLFLTGYVITVMYSINETIPILTLFINPLNFLFLLVNGGKINIYAILTTIIYLILINIAYKRNCKYYKTKERKLGKYD